MVSLGMIRNVAMIRLALLVKKMVDPMRRRINQKKNKGA